MKILVSAANGKTGRHVIESLRARADTPLIRGLGARPVEHTDESLTGDMNDPTVLARAVHGVDAVIHYGPPMHPREAAMGTGMIDAAVAAGVRRFVFISVIHPEIDDLMNHQAKLAIEAHLINSRLDWTVLRPQHYMQNIDVPRCVREGQLTMPYPVDTVLGHVDMRDLAEAVAKVVMEPGHIYATYDVSAAQALSVRDLCATIYRLSGVPVQPKAIDVYSVIDIIRMHWQGPLSDYSIEAFHRLFGYYARHGIQGNPNVLTWLLGRPPATFEEYVSRSLPAAGAGALTGERPHRVQGAGRSGLI
jgi:uncharacterized protein YbjT (DUF2867 family)